MSGPQLDARLRLLAQDESARILADAARNIRTLANEVGRTGQATQQHMRRSKESTDEFAKSIADATIGTLGLVTSVGGAVETVRQSVLKFADVSSMLSRIGKEGGMTKDQVANLRREFTGLANQTTFAFDQIGKAYRDFQSKTELTGEAAKSAFGDIARAASYAGVEIPSMTRAYVAAMGTLKVSQGEMKGVLDAWVKELPGSMDEFAEAAPRATAEMARFGLTGRQNAIELGAIFNQLGTTFGNARAAGNHFQATLGAIGSTPVLAHTFYESVRAGGSLTDALEKIIEQLNGIGALDPSEKGLMIAEKLGVNSESQRSLIAIRDHMSAIRNGAREGAAAVGEINRKMAEGGDSPGKAIHQLSNAWDELQTSIGETAYKLGAGTGMREFAAMLNDLRARIDDVREALDKLAKGDFSGAFSKLGTFMQGVMNPSSQISRMLQLGNPLTAPFAAQRGIIDFMRNRSWGRESEFDKRFRGEDVERPQEENTKALKDLTDELRKRAGAAPASYTPTSLGGLGGSGGGAVPQGFRSGGGYSVQGQQFGGGGGAPGAGGGGGGLTPGPSAPGGGQVPRSMGPEGGAAPLQGRTPGEALGGSVGTGRMDRSDYTEEMRRDPELRRRLQTIVQGEVGHGASRERKMVQLETIFNRARARGQSLRQVTEQYTGPGSRGYYPAATFSGGRIRNEQEYERFQRDIMDPALAGSDVSTEKLGFPATGNASGGVAARGVASGRYTRHGMLGPETYVQEGNWGRGSRGAREDIRRLEASRMSPSAVSGLDQPALTQRPDMPTEAPPELRAPSTPSFDERFGAAYRGRQSSLEDAQRLRSDLERPIKMSVETPQMPSQLVPRFRRASARESLQREVRDARWLSYSDIGAA